MFTGIVEGVGRVASLERGPELARLCIEAAALVEGVRVGDSVAVNGACLTVTGIEDGRLRFEAVPETLSRTTTGSLAAGDAVNLERALRAGARLDGHIVQGHVDGTGSVLRIERSGDDARMHVACGADVGTYLVEKGSVAIDGVSLTVVGVHEGGFDVALIPHTLSATTLGAKRVGDRVNLEADVLGKYVMRYLERLGLGAGGGGTPRGAG